MDSMELIELEGTFLDHHLLNPLNIQSRDYVDFERRNIAGEGEVTPKYLLTAVVDQLQEILEKRDRA